MKTKAAWYSIRRNTAMAAAVIGALAAAEVWIYGDIGESYWQETVSAKSFIADINALDVEQMTIRINSIGGSVPDGLAIYNAIKRHKATVTTEIDGVAFSIATLIAQAGDTRRMAANAMFMVHAPWAYTGGNAVELRDMADQLDAWAAGMSTSYASATGRPQPEMLALLMDGKDHYYTAEEALAEKFIDAISDAVPPAAMASAQRDFGISARYRNVPAAWLQAGGVDSSAASAASPVAQATPTQEDEMKRLALIALAAARLMAPAGPEGTIISGTGTGTGTGTSQPPATPLAAAQPTEAARTAILAAERLRTSTIRASALPFMALAGIAQLVETLCNTDSLTPEAAGLQILAHVGKDATPVAGGRVITVEAEADKIRNASITAILARAGVMGSDGKRILADSSNPFRGHTLVDMAKASLQRGGVKFDGQDKMGIVGMSFTQSSSDFPILLENVMNKTLQAAYALQPFTWSRWAKTGTVSDFRLHRRYRRGSFGNLDTVNEAGEFKTKAIPDGERASISAITKGNLVSLTRVAVINDDLDAFLGIASDLGQAAARSVEADAIAALVANAALSQDGVALFHASRKNLGTAAVSSVASFDEARSLMALQTNVGGNDFLDLRPAIWLGPTALGGTARVVNDSQYDPDSANKLQRPNMVRGLVQEVIDTPRLTGTAWYLLADKDICPTVEVAFLDGNQTPFLDLQQGFSVDGAQWKVRLDYGVAAVDYRGAVRNAGA
jgi:ATP-dependent protease ClpP protease subunit